MIVVSLHTDDIIALPGIICYGMFLHREVFLMGWVLPEFEAFSNIYSENYVEFHFKKIQQHSFEFISWPFGPDNLV